MRTLIVLAALLTPITIDAAASAPYKWCAYYNDGSTNCGFPTRWACQAAVSGVGGLCARNPRWRGNR